MCNKLPESTWGLRYGSLQLWLPALHHTILLYGPLTFLWAFDFMFIFKAFVKKLFSSKQNNCYT